MKPTTPFSRTSVQIVDSVAISCHPPNLFRGARPVVSVVSTNSMLGPEKLRAAGAKIDHSAPGGRHAATFRCNAAHFPGCSSKSSVFTE